MNKIKFILAIITIGSALTLSSCSDFMDIVPSTEYTEDMVFSDAGTAQAFVTQLYNDIMHGAKEHTLDGLTDDAYFTHNYGQKAINEAAVSESGLEWYGRLEGSGSYRFSNNPFHWQNRYRGIRNANLAIARIDEVPPKSGYDLKRMKGEAYYLRAHMYHELLRGYGGVPIAEIYTLDDPEAMKIPRNTVGEVLELILADLTVAEQNLTVTVPDAMLGRVTKYVATGMKARIALHVASPLYADRTINTLACNQYTGDRMALYRIAKNAAINVIENGPYRLIDCSKGTNIEKAELFKAIITDKKNSEQMFVRNFGIDAGDRNFMGRWHGPNGYYNWAGTTPSHDLVMAYEFEDGSLATPNDPEPLFKPGDWRKGNPYNGREPRFYATVATDGNTWGRPRGTAGAVFDPTPMGTLQAGTYELTAGSAGGRDISIVLPAGLGTVSFYGIPGVDTRQGPIEDWNGSWTGYYERKLIDCSVDAQGTPQAVPWTFMRLAEMYTIAAEASVELGELEDAEKYIDILRARVGNVPIRQALAARGKSFNQADLREAIRHERRVEFAYESNRYYDVRRWLIADVTNSKPLCGIRVIARLKPGATQGMPYIHNETKYDYFYYVNPIGNENRRWDNKMYFAPISLDEMRRNPNLKQNPGMGSGS
ncbi:MAG: RagB/SusD family nutrient uptake outer membrane protein [Tannerella sp.]|jgi:hypothetical protein|nr:RagB/SusD family nutrient uptake outer membrane protein [Tannerella sp.]